MSDFTLSDFTVGMTVTIDRVATTVGYHFLPAAPGNTATVVGIEEDAVVVDLAEITDDLDDQRTPEILAQNAIHRKNWKFAPNELLITSNLVTSDS